MSMFNKDEFLSRSINASLSTSRPPIPEGEDYMASIKSLDIRTPNDKYILDVIWLVDDERAREATGMQEPTVKQSVFLDFKDGMLDTSEGANIGLGRLRHALGQNDASMAWNFNMLMGAAAKLRITQRPDDKKPDVIYNDVANVTNL